MFLGGCPCCGPGGCWYKAMDSQCSPGNPGDGWMKKADITNTGCPDCCWSFYEQYNYANVNYIASLLYDLSVGTVLNDSLSGFVCNSNVFSGDGFIVTQNTLVFTETTRPHEIGFTEENENGSIYGGYYEGAFIAEAETNIGFGPAVFSIGFKESVTGGIYNGVSIYTSKPFLTIPLGIPGFENLHLYKVIFRDNTGVDSNLSTTVDYDPNTGAPLERMVINSRSFGGYEWEGVCTGRDIKYYYKAPYLWQNQSHLLAGLDDINSNSNLFQVYRGIGSQTISNENWNASNQTLSESVSYYSLEDGSETRKFDFSFSWPDLTSVFTRRRASHCGEPDSRQVRSELTCVSNDFCKDGTIYDSFEAAVYGEYMRQCYYTDYEYACEKIDDKPDDMQYQVCGNYEPGDCVKCFPECPEATGYKMAKELTDNPPEDGDSFFGSVTYDNKKINVTWNGSIPRPMYQSTTGEPPTRSGAFRAELTRSFRSVSLNGSFLQTIPDPNQSSGSLISTSYELSGRIVRVSANSATGVFDQEAEVSFAGKNIKTSMPEGLGTSVCFLVPCQSESCNVSEPIQQDDFKGPLTITVKGKQRQAYDTVMEFEFQYGIEVPDSFYQSHCWLCPDEPKPTIPIDYDVLGLEPVFTPSLGGRTMPTTTTGPGTELAKLLKWFGIKAKEKGCGCKSHAKRMDREGPQWCRDNIETIIGWLAVEAKKRKLPFIKQAAKQMVLIAIRRAEKKA